ncbi:hypothetical protein HMPREF9999_00467 [Alloprevotella sp. oral taxon 473 str. F0040]|nr:hypothetical protein HMPREF9999_00467 [Alloprevotella sp. oral taxon 473 str. F0040]
MLGIVFARLGRCGASTQKARAEEIQLREPFYANVYFLTSNL